MNKAEAQKFFARFLKGVCPECGKPAGELCDTPAVWVHAGRMTPILDAERKRK